MIRLINICKSYKTNNVAKEVLKGINCAIKRGELVAIMGKSGAGKSTLLNIIGGLLEATAGQYLLDDCDVTALTQSDRDRFREQQIGLIVQDYALIDTLTAYDNIAMPLEFLSVGKQETRERVYSLAAELEISPLLRQRAHSLSGGECQRVAIARALIKRPTVLLADEPTGALDEQTEQKILELLQKLKQDNRIIVLATHSRDVASCCDRVLRIENGVLIDALI